MVGSEGMGFEGLDFVRVGRGGCDVVGNCCSFAVG